MAIKADPATARKYLAMAGKLVASVCLPPPPSTNNLFNSIIIPRNPPGRGRYGNLKVIRPPTDEYKAWIEANAGLAQTLRSPTSYPVRLRYTLTGKWYKARDAGNIEKPVTDLLVSQGVLAGDNLNHVVGIVIGFEPSEAEPMLRVEIEETTTGLFGG